MTDIRESQPTQDAIDRDAIKSITPLSTGRCFQHKEHRHGSLLPQLWWVLTSQSWVEIPIGCMLIEHKDGLVLFDTGMDPAIVSDPNYISQTIGRFLLQRIFRFDIQPADELGNKLKSVGIDPSQIQKAIISHLHFDHIGGIAGIPQADLLVSEREWAALSGPHPEREWILREHIEIPGARWSPISFEPATEPALMSFEGCFDVMGDGSLMVIPTPGHTPGSISMLVRSSIAPPILLIGDLAYSAQAIMEDRVPGTGDAKQLRSTYAKVRHLKKVMPDLVIVPAHDDAAISRLNSVLNLEARHAPSRLNEDV